MAAAQEGENHGDEWGLTWYFLWGIYTSIPTWTHSQNSLAAAEAPSLKISAHGTSLKWSIRPPYPPMEHLSNDNKTIPISTRIVIRYAIKRWEVNGNWDNNIISISQCRESHCRTNTSVRRKEISPKEQDCENQCSVLLLLL